jgi:AAA domain/Domain of unknown function (DUF3854)
MTSDHNDEQKSMIANDLQAAPISGPNGDGRTRTPVLRLLLPHRKQLVDSAISETRAAQRGYWSAVEPDELATLGLHENQQRTPCLVIPIRDWTGNIVTHMIRPDNPRLNDKGKPVKYEYPRGMRNVIDVPPYARPYLGTTHPLGIAEGSKKADSGCSAGFPTVSINGVFGWRGKNQHGNSTALPDFEVVALKGRDIWLLFDSDGTTKREVEAALRRFVAWLRSQGARVHVVRFPPKPDGSKCGFDDYLAMGGTIEGLGDLEVDMPESTHAEPILIRADTVTPTEVDWIWEGRIPRGKLTLFAGNPDLGKTYIALWIAARITRGEAWPDGGKAEPGNVLILSAEDTIDDTLVPRLIALGADLTRVTFLKMVRGHDGTERMPNLDDDLAAVDAAIEEVNPALTIIDPLSAYSGRRVNTWRDSDIRTVLGPAAAVAEKHNTSFIGIMHFNKAADLAALARVMGSVGFTAAARSVLGFVPHPDDENRRIMVSMKHNLSKVPKLLTYELVEKPGNKRPTVEWFPADKPSITDLQSLVNPAHKKERAPDPEAADEAVDFLRQMLGKGAKVEATEVHKQAKLQGISEITLKRAKKSAMVESEFDGQPGKPGHQEGKPGKWWWWIPVQPPLFDQAMRDAQADRLPAGEDQPPSGEGHTPEGDPLQRSDEKKSLIGQDFSGEDQAPGYEPLQGRDEHLRPMLKGDEIGAVAKANLAAYLGGKSKRTPVGPDGKLQEPAPLVKVCPRCSQGYSEYPATSRLDNRALICPACGLREALSGMKRPGA